MYIENWESFYQQAELLYKANPLRTRHSIKYRHCDGKLVIKVTDDNTVRVGWSGIPACPWLGLVHACMPSGCSATYCPLGPHAAVLAVPHGSTGRPEEARET